MPVVLLTLIGLAFVVVADEFNECPGNERTIIGTTYLSEGDRWVRGEPIGGIELEIESSCGNEYANIVSGPDGKYSVTVKGPISIDLSKDSPYFSFGYYIHNKNTRGNILIKEGKEVIINILNSRFNTFPKSNNILICEDGVHTFSSKKITLVKNMGNCKLIAHDNEKVYESTINLQSAMETIDVELTRNLDSTILPDLITSDEGEFVFNIKKGWNLVHAQTIGNEEKSTCFYNDLDKISFFYEPLTKKYISNYDEYYDDFDSTELEENKEILYPAVLFGSAWFYSPIDCQIIDNSKMIERKADEEFPTLKNNLFAAWNFRYVTEFMLGKSLNQLEGSCDMVSAYYFNSVVQFWEEISLDDVLDTYGRGLLIKVSSDCNLGTGGGSTTNPPSLPEFDNGDFTKYVIEKNFGEIIYYEGSLKKGVNSNEVLGDIGTMFNNPLNGEFAEYTMLYNNQESPDAYVAVVEFDHDLTFSEFDANYAQPIIDNSGADLIFDYDPASVGDSLQDAQILFIGSKGNEFITTSWISENKFITMYSRVDDANDRGDMIIAYLTKHPSTLVNVD